MNSDHMCMLINYIVSIVFNSNLLLVLVCNLSINKATLILTLPTWPHGYNTLYSVLTPQMRLCLQPSKKFEHQILRLVIKKCL